MRKNAAGLSHDGPGQAVPAILPFAPVFCPKVKIRVRTSCISCRDGLQGDRLPLKWAAPLIAMLVIATWVSVIGVAWLGRLAISYLVGI